MRSTKNTIIKATIFLLASLLLMISFFTIRKSASSIFVNKEESALTSKNLTDNQNSAADIDPWTIGTGEFAGKFGDWSSTSEITAFNDGKLFIGSQNESTDYQIFDPETNKALYKGSVKGEDVSASVLLPNNTVFVVLTDESHTGPQITYYTVIKEDGSIVYQDYVRAAGDTVVHALAVTDKGDIMIGTDDGYLKLIFNPESASDHRDSREWVKTEHTEKINTIVPYLNPYGQHNYFIGYDKNYYETYGVNGDDNIWNRNVGGRLDKKENKISSGVDLGNQEVFVTTNSYQVSKTQSGYGGKWEVINADNGKVVRQGTLDIYWGTYLTSCELLSDGNVFVLGKQNYAVVDPRTGEILWQYYIENDNNDSALMNSNEVIFSGDGGKWRTIKFGNLINDEYSIDVDSFNLHNKVNDSIQYDVNINRNDNKYNKRPNDKIDDFKIKTTLTPEEGSNADTIVNVSQNFSGSGNKTIDAIDGLKKGVTYEIELTLLDSAGKETYSPKGNTIEKHKMNDQIPGYEHHINDILDAKVDYTHIGDGSFDFSITTNDDGTQYEVSPYKVNVYADHNGTTSDLIWTSNELTHGLRNEFFTVNNLSDGETYSNISYSLYDINEQSEIGPVFETRETVSFFSSILILDAKVDYTNIGDGSFDFSITTNDDGSQYEASPYKVNVYADHNGITNDLIWTSNELTNHELRNEFFTVNNLSDGETYSNISYSLYDVNKQSEIGSIFETRETVSFLSSILGINDVSLDWGTQPTSSSFNMSLTTEDSGDQEFSPYKIKVIADHGARVQEVVWTSEDQTNGKRNELVTVSGLMSSTRYSNIRVKLVDSSTGNVIGNESQVIGSVTTADESISITSATINNSTSNGFNFSIDIEGSSEWVPSYRVQALTGSGSILWTSEEQKDIGVKSFSVENLTEGNRYNDIGFQLVAGKDTEKIYGEKFDTQMDIVPTDNKVEGINSGSAKIVEQSNLEFTFSVDISSANQVGNFVSPYRVMLFQDGDTSNPIWISDEMLTVGNNLKFDVTHLRKGTYTNVQAQTIEMNTLDKIGESSMVSENLVIKPMLGAGAISGIVIGSLAMLVIIVLVSTFIVREIQKNYYKRKIYNDQYINGGF